MKSLTIPYPPEVLWALQKEPEELESEARLLLALKLSLVAFWTLGGCLKRLLPTL